MTGRSVPDADVYAPPPDTRPRGAARRAGVRRAREAAGPVVRAGSRAGQARQPAHPRAGRVPRRAHRAPPRHDDQRRHRARARERSRTRRSARRSANARSTSATRRWCTAARANRRGRDRPAAGRRLAQPAAPGRLPRHRQAVADALPRGRRGARVDGVGTWRASRWRRSPAARTSCACTWRRWVARSRAIRSTASTGDTVAAHDAARLPARVRASADRRAAGVRKRVPF